MAQFKTLLEKMVGGGIRFSHSIHCCCPEIPEVQDVLFALRLSDQEEYYSVCMGNHEPYIGNVHLVAAAIGTEILMERPYDETVARLVIAKAILALYPEHACCVGSICYTKVLQQAGERVPSGEELERRLMACKCESCCERKRFVSDQACYDLA